MEPCNLVVGLLEFKKSLQLTGMARWHVSSWMDWEERPSEVATTITSPYFRRFPKALMYVVEIRDLLTFDRELQTVVLLPIPIC
jgi:hypothetical protein